jgi:ferredoxin
VSQVFFGALFLWFCVVTVIGARWWQLRGWPINWLLQLDPLVALGTLLTTRTVYTGLLWALLTVVLTVALGRFFCGWVCPFGALHQFVGWLGRRTRKHAERVAANQYRPAQAIKYLLLTALLSMAAGGLLADATHLPRQHPVSALLAAAALAGAWAATRKGSPALKSGLLAFGGLGLLWFGIGWAVHPETLAAASLQTGLLDPIPLAHRSVNLMLLMAVEGLGTANRISVAAWALAAVFWAAVLLNLWIPRFYCRFVCPLGALFGVLARWTPWRIGKREGGCSECELCEQNCEGACDPFGKIRLSECLLCMNCLRACRQTQMGYGPRRSAGGEIESYGLTRRGFLTSAIAGVTSVPAVRLAGGLDRNWNAAVVRPPGSLAEEQFLERCLKCGQCMRLCPTNVLQPAMLEAGLEGLWTPVLNFRAGSSGCQLNCVACGQICPTAAIRPLTPDEKLGRGNFQEAGPIRMGTAFVDRGRCLPWAMDMPCIVCQENCPASPKAIYVREEFQTINGGVCTVAAATPASVTLAGAPLAPGKLATGDYFARVENAPAEQRQRITANTANRLEVAGGAAQAPAAGSRVFIEVRLQKPMVDPEHCIGCGICQHECPVSGLRAIRVTAENESRTKKHSLLARG